MTSSNKQLQKGFSLAEVLVSLAIFGMVMAVGTGAVLSLVNASYKSRTLSSTMSNVQIALDQMSRTIREGSDYDATTNGGETLIFKVVDPNDATATIDVVYDYDATNKTITVQEDVGSPQPITGPDVKILSLKFITPSPEPDVERVTMMIHGQVTAGRETSDFYVQTLVSQR